MGFNGIGGYLSEPGMIPYWVVIIYFAVVLSFIFLWGKRTGATRKFTTLDYVYIGIGAALANVWEFYIGSFLNRAVPSGLTSFIDFAFWGRLFILLVVATITRKVGTGMLSLAIFNLLSDILHYGFSGEPIFTMYETLTYGLFLDIMIAITGKHLFGLGYQSQKKRLTDRKAGTTTSKGDSASMNLFGLSGRNLALILAAVEGGIVGLMWAFPDPIFYSAFFKPLLYGAVVNWQKIIFGLVASIPGDVILGILAALAANRVARVL